MGNNTLYSQICHKYIHIMGWKNQIRKEIATWQKEQILQFLALIPPEICEMCTVERVR